MDIKKYIESGVLEQYLLGLLSADEALAVEKNITEFPEIKAALQAIEQNLADFAIAESDPLPESLSQQILNHIDSLDQGEKSLDPKKGNTIRWVYVLFGLLLAIAGYLMINNDKKQRQIDQQIAIIDSLNTINAELQAELVILKELRCPPIYLSGQGGQPNAIAAVYRNPESRKNYFEIQTLAPAPEGKQYQLWALIDGQPEDMGVLPLEGIAQLHAFPFVEGADAFAVTLEPEGGSENPTLSAMVLYGEVG